MDEPAPSPAGVASTPFDPTAPPDLPIRVITRLVVVGENIEIDLPPEQERFTLGAASAPAVDLTVRGELVSRLHAVLTRKGAKLRVVDQKSTNGTFYKDRREPDFELSPGEVFEVSRRVKLLALDPGLAILRHRLLWGVGLRNRAAADEAIQRIIAPNEPILLVGPAGCEQHAIAAEIHRRSAFNDREFVIAPSTFATRADQIQVLARGTRSNVFVDLTRSTAPPPAYFVEHLFADCRPIIAAPTRARAFAALDRYADRLRAIDLATPAERPDDIPRLLDALIIEEHARAGGGELLPVAALGAANVDALKAHPWPDHFVELRAQAKRLHAVLTNGLRLRASARALGLKSPTALVQALDRIGVRLSPRDDDDAPAADEINDLPTPPGAPTRP